MTRRLEAFPALDVDGVRVWIDRLRPVAVLQRPGRPDRVITWPGLFTGWAEPSVTVVAAPHAVWVHYGLLNSVEDDDPLRAVVNDVDAPAVHLDVATETVSIVRVGRDQVLGATAHGLWTTGHQTADPDPDDPYLGGPLPPDWHEDTPVTVHRPDGTTRQLTVDRSVLAVDADDRHLRILVYASPPVAVPIDRWSTHFEYRPTELLLPVERPLPDRIRFRDLVPEGWGEPAGLDRAGWPQRATMLPAVTDEVPAADGDWAVVDPPNGLQQHAVDFIVRQLVDLEHYWHPEDGGPGRPLSDGLTDATVTVEGEHPRTRVDVVFRHPAFPGGRLRRSCSTYDLAGRMRIDPDLAIRLMEDLDTRDLPSPSTAVDGILDI